MPVADRPTVLHYTGYDTDRGGILSVVRALAGTNRFACVLRVSPRFVQARFPRLETLELPRIAGDTIDLRTFWRARIVARAVRSWLNPEGRRIYHGHSRAGLLVGLWLVWQGERRVAVSVHCYGHQRWFYRWATRRLGQRLFWLSPAMKDHYGIGNGSWTGCIPGCTDAPPGSGSRRRWRCDGTLRLGGAGALVRWKRWDLVLTALRQLEPPLRAGVEFRHIGAADESPESQRCAAALREQSAGLPVSWEGWRADPASFFAGVDALVVASKGEPFSVAMLEALAAGIPVLAADRGGAVDVIQPPLNGWLFKTGDASSLAGAIRRLLDPDGFATVKINPEGLRRFAPAAVAGQWRSVYAALMSEDGV